MAFPTIAERLRSADDETPYLFDLCQQAAEEIERLSAENQTLALKGMAACQSAELLETYLTQCGNALDKFPARIDESDKAYLSRVFEWWYRLGYKALQVTGVPMDG